MLKRQRMGRMLVHYIFKADDGAARNESETTSSDDFNGIKFVTPRAWVARAQPGLGESAFDLHQGLDTGEIDTVPAELFNDLFKPSL